jgi:signal transduction histidine kinase
MGAAATVRLLCVDPDSTLLRYLVSLFKDVLCAAATGGIGALEAMRQYPDIALLLLDPKLATPQLVGEFLAHQPQGLIIWVSQQGIPAELEAAAGDATFRALQRPVREGDLVQTVRQALAVLALRREAGRHTEAPRPDEQAWASRVGQLTDLNRLKDELVMIVAHDIRAPLSVILGYCDILQGNEPDLSVSGREILGRIQHSANRLLTMVNNVLNLAAIEEGRMELKLAPTRLSAVVTEVIDSLAGMAQEAQVECQVEIRGDERSYELDAVKVAQVLQNLVSNAIKFNQPGGTVDIRVAGSPEEVAFEVRDSGRGMTPDQASRAFDKFIRFASGASSGSGLGLAIARGLTTLQGGAISLDTHPGAGTTFRFTVKPGHRAGAVRPLLE